MLLAIGHPRHIGRRTPLVQSLADHAATGRPPQPAPSLSFSHQAPRLALHQPSPVRPADALRIDALSTAFTSRMWRRPKARRVPQAKRSQRKPQVECSSYVLLLIPIRRQRKRELINCCERGRHMTRTLSAPWRKPPSRPGRLRCEACHAAPPHHRGTSAPTHGA